MTGIELKIAQGQQLDSYWYGIATKVGSRVGSIILPEKQEKRLYAKVDTALEDVRKMQKTMVGVSASVGAGAIATLALAGAILWTRWRADEEITPPAHPLRTGLKEYKPLSPHEQEIASHTVPEEIAAWRRGKIKSREQAIAIGLSRARRGG